MTSMLRILVIDDNKDIHEDFRKVFAYAAEAHKDELGELQADFFDDQAPVANKAPHREIVIDSAFQGKEGVELALNAARQGNPHVMAFVDVRMPPGIDGVQTIKKLWEQLPDLQCVLCTAFSDYDWEDLRKELDHPSNLLILKKPFDPVEVLQLVESIAEKVELSRASREYRRELESQIAELTQAQQELKTAYSELESARAQAEMAATAKGQFLANMSHELRTPLNGVIAMTDMLLFTTLDAQQEKYVRTAKSSGESLLELINDILDFSRIESGKIELEAIEFTLHREIEAVITVAARKCQEKKLELACFIDPKALLQLRGDPARMRQILNNLVSNAVKFTAQGEVVVEITVTEELDDTVFVQFKVTDTGIGIPPERHERLFCSFSQVDASTTRRFGGTGLGLAISKQLCEMMGGQIGFSSEPGVGSQFWFTIPLERVGGSSVRSLVPPDFRNKRILLVDDNTKVCEILERQLTAWGLDIAAVGSMEDASGLLMDARAQQRPFAAMLLDREIGGSSIDRIAATLQSTPGLETTPVVLLVPLGQPGRFSELLGQGVVGFVNKPIVPSELFNVLMRLDDRLCGMPSRENGGPRSDNGVSRMLPVPKTRHADARILLAEDNAINQKVATQILSCFGYSFDIVSDGKQAVDALQTGAYDLVLMDCQMPEMDGLEATRVIRQKEGRGELSQGRSIPIIALTANALEGDRAKCLSAGMSDYLSKPLRPEQLLEVIEKYLSEALSDDPAPAEGDAAAENAVDANPVHGTDVADGASSAADATASTETIPPPLDMESFVDRCMGDRQFALQLLDEFEHQVPDELVHLAELIHGGDDQQLVRRAHTLKGLAANVSADGLRSAASELEHSAREGNRAAAERHLADVQAQWLQLQRFLICQRAEMGG